MTHIIRLALSIPLFLVLFSALFLFGLGMSSSSSRLDWGDTCIVEIIRYVIESQGVRSVQDPTREDDVIEVEIAELVTRVFNNGYLCNDEDKAMYLQKTEEKDYRTIKRLSFVAYFIILFQRPHVYKIEFVDEKITFISPSEDVPHNLVDQKYMERYKGTEKVLIEQTIIRDGERCLIAESMMPMDGQPDFIFKNTYVETKDNTLIHAETNTLIIDKEAPTMFKKYIEEMLGYLRRRNV